jgi:hypothetical protein
VFVNLCDEAKSNRASDDVKTYNKVRKLLVEACDVTQKADL